MSEFSSPITYNVITKHLTNCVETSDKGCKGFLQRHVASRILALAISLFQIFDLLWNATSFVYKGVALAADKMGCGFVSKETLKTYSLKNHATGMLKNTLGIALGTPLSFLAPRTVVPFCFAPEDNLFAEQIDKAAQYPFDNHFDKTFVINMAKAVAKRKEIEAHLDDIGVKNYERFEAVNGYALKNTPETPWARMPGTRDKLKQAHMGCYMSHLEILREAKKRGLNSVLILEDDAFFPKTARGVQLFNQGMAELPPDYDFAYLGYGHDEAPTRYSEHLDKINAGVFTHAYAINGQCFDRLIADLENELKGDGLLLPIDQLYSKFYEQERYKAFAVRPNLCVQKEGAISDITGLGNAQFSLTRQVFDRFTSYLVLPFLKQVGIPKNKILPLLIKCGAIYN